MAIVHSTPADSNIFVDLGFGGEEAENLKLRSTLMIQIRKIIERDQLRQVDAAARFGVSQPRISDLVRGRIGEFTIDSLVNMLAHASLHVEVTVSTAR